MSDRDAEAGRKAYRASCALCHGPAAQGLKIQGGPPLTGMPAWLIRRQIRAIREGSRGGGPRGGTRGIR